MIARVFKDLEVELDYCSDSDGALARAVETRYDAILLDDHVEDAHVVLKKLLGFATCGNSVRIVLAEPKVNMQSIYKTGSQVVIYKPLSVDRMWQALRAVRNLMSRERRRGGERVQTMVPAKISTRRAKWSARQVLIGDISDSGVSIRNAKGDLPVATKVNLEFTLPGKPKPLRCLAELVWQNHRGSGGLRFVDMPSYARQELAEWLAEHQKTVRRAASVGCNH
jgi:PilZ domain